MNGKLVKKEFILNNLLSRVYYSKHSIEQMKKRSNLCDDTTNSINYRKLTSNIKDKINNDFLIAYYNTDGSINVAISEYEYFVFAYNKDKNNYTLITFKEESWNGINIFKKRELALKGIDRK